MPHRTPRPKLSSEGHGNVADVETGSNVQDRKRVGVGVDDQPSDAVSEEWAENGDEKKNLIAKDGAEGGESPAKHKRDAKNEALSGTVVFACSLYCTCSVSMVMVNKSLASSYNHLIDGDLNFLLVIFQAVVAVVAVEFSKKLKWVEYPGFDASTAFQWAPVNVLFCGMLFTGMTSLQHNSVPMVTVFKNATNIVTTMGDFFFFGTTVDFLVMTALGIMLAGAVAAAWEDVYMTPAGAFWMVMNCLCTAGYVLYMKFATDNVKLSKFGMVFYNNLLCVMFLIPVTVVNGEIKTFLGTKAIHTTDYFLKNSFAGFVGFFLNFASLNCVSHTGPTTYSILGAINKIPIAFLGYFLFDSVITKETWFFIGVSMCGGFLYSFAKIRAGRNAKATSR